MKYIKGKNGRTYDVTKMTFEVYQKITGLGVDSYELATGKKVKETRFNRTNNRARPVHS